MVCVAAIALGASTYAWFVTNNTVKATTSIISAQSNAAFMKIKYNDTATTSDLTADVATLENKKLYPAQWANSFVLQIAKLSEGAQHGDNQSLMAISDGHKISPSSTNEVKNWYTCLGWGQDGKVHSYEKRDNLDADGKYTVDTDHYAYIKSEYILYTITETGLCDVYLKSYDDE